ncbi:MAG: winged helix-turn-helix transcriptional regulator [Candidatus Heimdallarchaeota archaeon]
MKNKIQLEIFEIIAKILNAYPVTIQDLMDQTGYSNNLINRHITKLIKNGFLEVKKVKQPKGRGILFFQLLGKKWPKHLGKKCGDCHNFNSKTNCTFHEELTDKEIKVKTEFDREKITKNTYACDGGFIERKRNWKRMRLEKFLAKARRVTKTEDGVKTSYHCLREDCQAELSTLGEGFIAKLGSSVVRCKECNSFYKMKYNQKKDAFYVHYNEEKGIEYKRNFLRISKGIEPEDLYSSDKHGIVINDFRDCILNFRNRSLIVNNFVGKLTEIKYIVAKRKEDKEYLEDILPSKGYDIDIILGDDKLVSPPPIKQHVGLLKLLREAKIVNVNFCLPMLENRIMIIKQVFDIFGRENEVKVRKAIKFIEWIIEEVKQKGTITPGEWNSFEMRAGKQMWGVIKFYLEKEGFQFPGRGKCRKVDDPSLPHRKAYAYSQIDTLIKGIFGISGLNVKEYCSEINFCWDGYPGLNHGKTEGGIFGFHFDLREPEKILPVLILLKAIRDGEIHPKEVLYFRGRNREKVYYLKQDTELYNQLELIVEESQKRIINGKKAKHVVRDHFLGGKQWLKDMQRRSNFYEVTHHGIDYQPWAIIKENVWNVMSQEEKNDLLNYLKEEHQQIAFKPFQIWDIN